MVSTEKEVQALQNRVIELEQQLAEAQAAILALTSPQEDKLQTGRQKGVDITDRKQAEERLRAARDEARWLARLPGENPNPVVRVSNAGIVLYRNHPAANLSGWTCAVNEPLPMSLMPLVQQAVIEDRVVEQDVSLGEKFYSVSVVPIPGEGYLNLYGRDITERKQADEALRESEERFSKAFHKAPFGMNITRWRDGTFIDVNDTWLELLGWTRDEILGRTTADIGFYAQPENRGLVRNRIMKDEGLGDLELHVTRKDGSSLIITAATTIIELQGERCILAVVNDITDRKRAEDALRKSEERFVKAFHASPNAIIISRLSDGLIMEVNEGWSTIFGHKPSEVLGRTTLALGIYANPEDRQEAIGRLKENGSLRDFETQVRRKSGEVRQASMSAERIEINGTECLLMIIRDITERKQAEEHITYQARLLASVNDAIVGSDAEFRLTAWNVVAESIYGWKAEEVLGRNGLELLQTQWSQEDANEMRRKIAETGRWRGEAIQLRRDGTRIPVEVSSMVLRDERGQITGYVSVNRDITERKKVEQALRKSEQRLNRAQEIAHLGSWELDLVNNQLTWSDEVYRIFGLEPQQFGATYEAFLEAVHPDDRAAVDNAYSSSIREGRDTYEIEHRVVKRSSGEVRLVREKCEHFRNQSGQIIRSVGMVHDITEHKRAEEQLKDYAERLAHSNRELEQFAFMASHDMQEPLRKIEMFGDLLLEHATYLNEHERNYLDRMQNAAGRMRDMVEGLLQLSRVATQRKPFIRVDLSQVTSEVLSDLEEQIRRTGGKVDLGNLPTIEGDPLQLHQLMQNLIGNALKYHEPETPPEVNVYAKQLSGKVQILVEDKGIGFEQKDAERIFQPFQRLVGRSQYEGSGMGLAICRRIVERHGGKIAAFSKPGHGTTLIVTLPIHHPESARNELRKDANNEDPGTTSGR